MKSALPQIILDIAQAVQRAGGRALLVGGAVRDRLLGLPVTDIDLEIYGLSADELSRVAEQFGAVNRVGRQFGILKVASEYGDIDLALPRRESKMGAGHRGFAIFPERTLPMKEAFARRDFTINAIGEDPLTGEIIDLVDGQKDLAERRLRIVNEHTFLDDPLRVLRAVQLVGRFALETDIATLSMLQRGVAATVELPPERKYPEWEKMFLKSDRPSLGLQLAHDIGYFSQYAPTIWQLATTPQDPKFHPEGDVWTHTVQAVDWAKRMAPDSLVILVATFLHDIGKSTTSMAMGKRIRSIGHEAAALEPAATFLRSQGFPVTLIDRVLPLVREHMRPGQLYAQRKTASPGAVRRLANRLIPATIGELAIVAAADAAGREPVRPGALPVFPEIQWLLEQAGALHAVDQPPAPLVQGADLRDLDWPAGPLYGQILASCETLAENGRGRDQLLKLIADCKTPEQALKRLNQEIDTQE